MTQFELDNKEATVSILFMYIVTLSVVWTLKRYNTKIKAMCELMLKGSKEVLIVLIDTYGTHGLCIQYRNIQYYVERVETRDIYNFAHNFLNIQLIFNPWKVLES